MDAAFKAVDMLVGVEVSLEDYSLRTVTEGIEALAVTRCVLRPVGSLAAQGLVQNAQVPPRLPPANRPPSLNTHTPESLLGALPCGDLCRDR